MEKTKGYVYILTNPSFREDWVKIGKSARPVDVRSKELDNTAVPLPFEIFATLKTAKYNEAEKLIHHYIERFTNLRIRNNREFFNVKPEEALDIFRDVALMLDDAEIDEVYKKSVLGDSKSVTVQRKEDNKIEGNKVWLMSSNQKFFDVAGCFHKYGEINWQQSVHFQKGDTGYIYSSSPDSAIKYRFEITECDIPYANAKQEREREFYPDSILDFPTDNGQLYTTVKLTGETSSSRLSLVHLLDNGLKLAPRGPMIISNEGYKDLLKYIENNF